MQQSLNELKTEILADVKKPDMAIDRVFASLDLPREDALIRLPGDCQKKITIDGGVLKVTIECTASDSNIQRANHLKEAAVVIMGVEPDPSDENPDQMQIGENGTDGDLPE